jgi:hypothetical protein
MNDSKKKTRRETAALNLLFVYATLEPSQRNLFQELLIQHLSPYQAPYSYWPSCEMDRRGCYLQLWEHVCPSVAAAWQKWASEIAEEDPCEDTVRVVILTFLKELVSMVFPGETLPSGTTVKM